MSGDRPGDVWIFSFANFSSQSLVSDRSDSNSGGGAFQCNLTGMCPFFKNLHNSFRKKFAFPYTVSELLNYKKFQKQ